jgi:hypothetical protein
MYCTVLISVVKIGMKTVPLKCAVSSSTICLDMIINTLTDFTVIIFDTDFYCLDFLYISNDGVKPETLSILNMCATRTSCLILVFIQRAPHSTGNFVFQGPSC